MELPKSLPVGFVVKIIGAVFALGMAYGNLRLAITQSNHDATAARQRVEELSAEVRGLREYLDARQRNGL